MNLEKSINNVAKRLGRFDAIGSSDNNTGLSIWKGKPIIPLNEWIKLSNSPYLLDYFPDDFDHDLTCISQNKTGLKQEDVKRWKLDHQELMEYTKNPNYGRFKCFLCLLSPDGDDPIFIGINRLVAKDLCNDKQENNPIEYPCQVVNRFQCPFERNASEKDTSLNVRDLFRLHKMAFAVELSLAKARKDDSKIRIRNKEELLQALTNEKILGGILERGAEANEAGGHIRTYLLENRTNILDYFMKIKDLVKLEELRLY